MKPVEQQAAACVSKGTKNGVVVHVDNMQLFGCVSRTIIVRETVLKRARFIDFRFAALGLRRPSAWLGR
jgi:hypothetical protein